MGLDMYLTKRTYVGNKYKEPAEQTKIAVDGVKQERVTAILEDVGYWRKANAIHSWFVENVQDGVDNCGLYYVSEQDMKTLLALVEGVLQDHSRAQTLLPTCEGFFFGSYDYEEYYFDDLRETKKILQQALKEAGDYYYQSSW